jgi:hypothetical protein
MKSPDDRHSDQDLKSYLDGRDGVSAAYRKTAQEEPPPALDARILNAARKAAQPATASWYASRRPYALAASVMVAVLGLSLYFGTLDELVVPRELQQEAATAVEFRRVERAAAPTAPPQEDEVAPQAAADAQFEARQLEPPVPAVGIANNAGAPAPALDAALDALALTAEVPPIVIDGPLLEEIEAEADLARTQVLVASGAQLEEIAVTGSRIVRREAGDTSYRESREQWLAEIRVMLSELEARSRLVTARRSASVLEEQIEEEIELFLAEYPDTDIDAELEEE